MRRQSLAYSIIFNHGKLKTELILKTVLFYINKRLGIVMVMMLASSVEDRGPLTARSTRVLLY